MAAKAKNLPWRQAVAPYQQSDLRISLWQVFTSIPPYLILWYLAYRSLEVSYWLTLPIAALAGLFGMRCFIIFHDAGHGSFFRSQRANDIIGIITGIITFTPYYAWRHSHAVHHATSGDLDRRGVGDIWTLTYEEYQKLPLWKRIFYRVYRNPFFIFVVGPVIDFVVLQRLPWVNASIKAREKNSVTWTNLALLGIVIVASLTIGLKAYVLVQLPIIAFAASFGVWLFYIQHQYENVYWERHEEWDFATAALYGSSYFAMPRILQWFTGNIGFHHIHHLSPRIPNYRLEDCHNENEMFRQIAPLSWRESLKSTFIIRVWDEDRHKMIGYHKPEETEAVEPALNATAPAALHGEASASGV
jgi:omega-6 fatty acid desaturase (delta-12 desaturase)